MVCDIVLAQDLTLNDPGLLGLCNVCDSMWKNRIPIICSSVFSKKSNKSLYDGQWETTKGNIQLTENEAIVRFCFSKCYIQDRFWTYERTNTYIKLTKWTSPSSDPHLCQDNGESYPCQNIGMSSVIENPPIFDFITDFVQQLKQ